MTDPLLDPSQAQPDATAVGPFDASALYRADNAPKDTPPGDVLFDALKGSIAPPIAAPPPQAAGTNPNSSTTVPTNQALLDRIKSYGVTDLARLNGMQDTELRDLANRVVVGEARLAALTQYFRKNPDGSFDFTMDPSGAPTGLDANGRMLGTPGASGPTGPTGASGPGPTGASGPPGPGASGPVTPPPGPTGPTGATTKPPATGGGTTPTPPGPTGTPLVVKPPSTGTANYDTRSEAIGVAASQPKTTLSYPLVQPKVTQPSTAPYRSGV